MAEPKRAVARIRAALEEHGLLLLQDGVLPSVTTVVAGEPISGSWWGHEKGREIWAALQVIDDEVATAKLVGGKVTFVHERLWPALAAIGREGADWQWKGLGDDARTLADEVEAAGQLRSDHRLAEATGPAHKALKAAIDHLEKRLLVYSEQIHTESGKHARVLTSWTRFVTDRRLRPPSPAKARAALAACVAPWPRTKRKGLLPW